MQINYRAPTVTSIGGRDGSVRSADGLIDLQVAELIVLGLGAWLYAHMTTFTSAKGRYVSICVLGLRGFTSGCPGWLCR